MDIILQIKEELQVEKWQVEAAVNLIDEGNTIPFISRYRKEVTGSLNDEQLRTLSERLTYLRNLEDKKQQVLGSIEEQGKLTEELKEKILAAQTLVVVEDLYRPYRPKRKTRASVAKEKGLDGLAQFIVAQNTEVAVEEEAAKYVSEEKEVTSVKDAIRGQRIFWQKVFPMRQSIVSTSEMRQQRKVSSLPLQRMKKLRVYTKCTIISKSLLRKWQDIVCWH